MSPGIVGPGALLLLSLGMVVFLGLFVLVMWIDSRLDGR